MTDKMTILTIDLEDWFHILDFKQTQSENTWISYESRIEKLTSKLLKFLEQKQVKATFFILGWVAKNFPNVVKDIHASGHEIACHSNLHQLVYKMTQESFKRDTMDALDNIEASCGVRPIAYRAPGFSITAQTPWAFDTLADAGIKYDCSVFPAPRSHGGLIGYGAGIPAIIRTINDKEVREFPINYVNLMGRKIVYSGGGYFRLMPGCLGRAMFRTNQYNMTYFHLRDFDYGQPVLSGLSPIRKFKSYVGIKGALMKLESLLNQEETITLLEAASMIDWKNRTRIYIKEICHG